MPPPKRILLLSTAFLFAALHGPHAQADDLQPLGDEFGNAATFSRYQEHGALEGWGPTHVESANINTASPGHFRIVPRTTGWYEHLRGTHFSKNVTGDFVVTAHVFVYSRQNAAGPQAPSVRLYSLGGILIREPRAITHAAPVPYTTNPVWPPENFGSDWTPGDETWANTGAAGRGENYLFLSLGTAGNAGTRQFEIKTTRRSRSELYYSSNGIAGSNEAWLQMIRVGSTIVCLRKHSAAGPWIVENRYPNPDHAFPQFGATLQVGLTAYTDFNSIGGYEAGGPQTQFNFNYITVPGAPDLILDVDYLRLQRPDPALTEAALQAMSTSYNPATNQTANPPVQLSASPAAALYLGDNANTPLGAVAFSAVGFAENERTGAATISVTRSGASTALPLALHYETLPGTAGTADFTAQSGTLSWAANDPATKTFLIPLSNDGLAEGPETLTVRLTQLDGPATFAASAPQIEATLTIDDAPFDQWRLTHFAAQANAPEGQAAADFESDGGTNLVEFALGGTPTQPDFAALRPASGEDSGRLTLSFTPAAASSSVTLRVEARGDLAVGTWQPLAHRAAGAGAWVLDDPAAAVSVAPGTGRVTVSDAVPINGGGKRFLRFSVGL